MARVLFLSYDGMLEPLGRSQVLAYLKSMALAHRIVLVSFEKSDDWSDAAKRVALIREISAAGIEWRPLIYHKRPPVLSTIYDVARATALCAWLIVARRVEIIHARSYVPALTGVLLKSVLGTSFVFDMRGFWADERVSHGIWPAGSVLYRLAKRLERTFILRADRVVSLTWAAVAEIRSFSYLQGRDVRFSVIPTCADLEVFPSRSAAPHEGFVLCYVGSVARYMFDEVLNCFKALRVVRPDARLLILNRDEPRKIEEMLRRAGLPASISEVRSVDYCRVAEELAACDAGVFFTKRDFAAKGHQPTRLAEFLACGLPCITNPGIGDVDDVIERDGAGVLLRSFGRTEIEEAVRMLAALASKPGIRETCRAIAQKRFALTEGVKAYDALYRQVYLERSRRFTVKTRALNAVRELFRWVPLERSLAAFTQGRPASHVISKLAPNHYQYPAGSIRRRHRDGVQYELDISDFVEWNVYFGLIEPSSVKLFSLPRVGDVVLDIGTNIGEVLLTCARLVGPAGRVFGFEPDPTNYGKCLRNLALNDIANASVQNIGLGPVAAELRMVVDSARNRGGNRISEDPSKDGFTVKVVPLDEFVAQGEIDRVDLIKIDVEGFELKVLQGGWRTVERFRPKLFIEVDDDNLRAQEASAAELVRELEARGYRVTSAEDGRTVTSADEFIGVHFDIVCMPIS